ncbi:FG-GAP repeat protein, partial [Vibrio parahaemolyticus]
KNNGTEWVQVAKLTASDGASFNYFGNSVAISGDTAIIGAYGHDSRKGAAYVFKNTGSEWVQIAKLTAGDYLVAYHFGSAVTINGDTAIIGSSVGDNGKGAAYIFKNTGSEWVQVAKLTPSDNLESNFGSAVAISGDTAIIGAYGDNNKKGAAYVY